MLVIILASPALAWRNGKYVVSSGGMLLNLVPPTYFSGNNPVLNWWSTASAIALHSTLNGALQGASAWNAVGTASPGGGTAYFNPNTGELNNPCPSDVTNISRLFFTPPPNYSNLLLVGNPWWYGQVFNITWLGTSTPTQQGTLGSGGTFVVNGANSATLTFGGAGVDNVVLTFPVSNVNDPPRSIKVFQSQYAVNVARGEFWNPDYLALIGQFKCLRFMDWMATNTTGISDISQLADANYINFASGFGGIGIFTATIDNGSGSAGNILNVTGCDAGTKLGIGMVVTVPGGSNATITALGTGTGLNGTYTINGSSQLVSSETMSALAQVGTFAGDSGPKAGVHPSLVCQLANLTRCDVHYNIPVAMTISGMAAIATYFQNNLNPQLKVIFEYGNENWNFTLGICAFYCNLQIYPGSGSSGQAFAFAGYRAAQLWEQAANVYGPSWRGRWRGALGSQIANTAVSTTGITGAFYWLANGSMYSHLTDLFNEIDVAPYIGDLVGANTITAVSTGATTTVTDGGSHSIGDKVRVFFSVASGLSAYNNTTVTVTTGGATSFQFTSPSTSGTFTNSGSNYSANGLLFDLMDQSAALNGSQPATYPTIYTYFAEQLAQSIVTGAAGFNGYATSNSTNLSGLTSDLERQALIANSYGLDLRQYEGGLNFGGIGVLQSGNAQMLNYALNYKYDTGQSGIYTVGTALAAIFGAMSTSAYSQYPAQYLDGGEPSPWQALRFWPGDEGNPTWQAIVAQNALGPIPDPTPPTSWTGGFVTDVNNPNTFTGSPATQSFTIGFGSNAAGLLIVNLASQNSPTVSSITTTTPSSGTLTLAPVVAFGSGGLSSGIYAVAVPANLGTQTISVGWSSGAGINRVATVLLLSNLNSNTAQATSTGSPSNAVIAVTKNCALVSSGNFLVGPPNYNGGTNGVIANLAQLNSSGRGASGLFKPVFSSLIFPVNMNVSNGVGQSLATFA